MISVALCIKKKTKIGGGGDGKMSRVTQLSIFKYMLGLCSIFYFFILCCKTIPTHFLGHFEGVNVR